jgi:CBS domain-containing protein
MLPRTYITVVNIRTFSMATDLNSNHILYGLCCEPRTVKARDKNKESTQVLSLYESIESTPSSKVEHELAKYELKEFNFKADGKGDAQLPEQKNNCTSNYQDKTKDPNEKIPLVLLTKVEQAQDQLFRTASPKNEQAMNIAVVSPISFTPKRSGSAQVHQILTDDYKVFSDNKKLDQLLRSTTAKSLASATNVPEVLLSTSISAVLQNLETDRRSCVLVRDFSVPGSNTSSTDTIFNRIDVFRFAIKARNTALPFSNIVEHMKPVHQVDGDTRLDSVIAVMMETGSEEIGVFDGEQGVVRGIITCKSIISFMRHHEQEHAQTELRRNEFGNARFEAEDDEAQLMSRTEKENQNRENVGTNRFSQAQLAAQVWRHGAADEWLSFYANRAA